MSLGFGPDLWRYRGFIFGSVKREFQAKYRNSLLGAAWNVLQPLAMITVYTVVFSELMRPRVPGLDAPYAYSVYLCAGLITWGLFSEILLRGQSVFLDNGNMIKKLSFPRICLPVVAILNALVNFSIIFVIFLAFLLLIGSFPGAVIVCMIPVLVVQIALATGLGIIAGVLNVFFRDVGQFVIIALQFWFWFTPIVYATSTLPAAVRPWMKLNPMAPLVRAYQDIFLYQRAPDWTHIWPIGLIATILCIFGLMLFRRRSAEMVDEL